MVVGRILTLAGDAGLSPVEAIAIRDGRILGAGRKAEIEPLIGPRTGRIELAPDELALPGLTDSHLHLAEAAIAAGHVQLAGAVTLADGLRQIRAAHAAAEPGAWLTGNGWSADAWGGWPTGLDLERVAPGRPIALWAHDHHALWVSPSALALAEVGAGTPDPPGGAIRRTEDGSPAGVLQETATVLVSRHVPAPTVAEYEAAVPVLCRELVALGVVAVHDPGALRPDPLLIGAHVAYANLAAAGRLAIRVHASIRAEALDGAIDRGWRSGQPQGGDPASPARIGWLKLFADGSLGSGTARMLAPFEPVAGSPTAGPADVGIWVTEPAELAELTRRAAAGGFATQIHGIGDAAVRAALDALEPAGHRSLPLRARIEHAQIVDPGDLARFGRLGIVASIQPVHLRSDADLARRAWGARAERSSYAWGSLLRAGAVLAFGTDAPVEAIDPWPGIALAVRRHWPGWPAGTLPFSPEEALSLDEALRGACLGPALAERSADRGRLTVGQCADLIVIPAAALASPLGADGALASTRPRLVLIDGRVGFEA